MRAIQTSDGSLLDYISTINYITLILDSTLQDSPGLSVVDVPEDTPVRTLYTKLIDLNPIHSIAQRFFTNGSTFLTYRQVSNLTRSQGLLPTDFSRIGLYMLIYKFNPYGT